ncbi:MAG: hypothetical protein NVS3B10_28330 [Polyangiales bacterium]
MNYAASLRCLSLLSMIGLTAGACSGTRDTTESVGKERAPIIGGTADSADTFVVGIDIGGSSVCSGTMIAPNLVLTARHCVSQTPEALDCSVANNIIANYGPGSFTVSTNRFYQGSPSWGVGKIWYVNDATCTGGSTDPACKLCGYDLALLELSGGGFPTDIRPPSFSKPKLGNYTAIGYGCQDAPTSTGGGCTTVGYRQRLEGVEVIESIGNDTTVHGRVCGGDSGSPLYDSTNRWIYGALSRGDGPTSAGPGCNYGTYTRTDPHMAWLQKYGAQAASDGGYAAPPWVTATAPVPDAGPPPAKGPLGSSCVGPDYCTSGLCVNGGDGPVCSQACTASKPCPAGYECASGYCFAAAKPPADSGAPSTDTGAPSSSDASSDDSGAGPDPNGAVPDAVTDTKGGCTVGAPHAPPPRPQPWIVGLGLALGVVLARRRR